MHITDNNSQIGVDKSNRRIDNKELEDYNATLAEAQLHTSIPSIATTKPTITTHLPIKLLLSTAKLLVPTPKSAQLPATRTAKAI